VATNSALEIPQRAKPVPIGSRAVLGFVADLWALTKPEINLLIAITVLVSFLLGRHGSGLLSILPAFNAMVGTLFVSSGAAALNQFMERRFDSRMRRTGRRPLVTGSVTPRSALLFGTTVSIIGLFYLAMCANPLSMLLAGLTLLTYLLAYTPLKRITPFCTFVGAIPGAASPLIGWAAASGTLDRRAWALYALLFLWQFPHFMAIAWMYRDDYERAGYRILPDGLDRRLFAAIQAAIPAILLVPVSLVPWMEGQEGNRYMAGAIFLGLGFGWAALRFSLKTSNTAGRKLLFASIVYLPAIFILLLLNKR
jgi:protoheme IX farnesyltransferase